MIAISVIIPTYLRPKDLTRCLEALKQQTRPADEVLVVVRDSDNETWALFQESNFDPLPIKTVTVEVPGVVAALNAALDVATGDIITVTDDDAAPHTDWLKRIETYYLSDERLGGVGGRDWVYWENKLLDHDDTETVGQVQWFGRVIGNHHRGVGKAREVDILKGVNMSYRRSAIAEIGFDERMWGTGAQVNFEMALCLTLKRKGWKLVYDPAIAVDHYPAKRFDEDKRDRLNEVALVNAVHNETLVLLENLPPVRRVVFMLWAVLVGTQESLGLIQWLRFFPKEGKLAQRKWLASLRGRWQGLRTWQQSVKVNTSN
ncbi:MAG: glycosyltransferase family 2 protein [Chlorogloeopsis fritschii C42_A2020_084]|uniref:glycosyltransferase family 2 protein n=1 Tax=Chlorogloeopsis fritschii TaxID=1124 RepID=UPI0019EAF0B4|nr:glycosyltransferase family 2 protein [Chlorogloeopsis fritschii]MBF2004727.1 glycosyltransferase family 2 protein [Chlorogloeopsis fritschii C42_A2020_084]